MVETGAWEPFFEVKVDALSSFGAANTGFIRPSYVI